MASSSPPTASTSLIEPRLIAKTVQESPPNATHWSRARMAEAMRMKEAPLPTKRTVVASAAPSPAASAPGFKSAAILPKMELELTYAHPNRQEEYRTSTHAMMPVTKLLYTWKDPAPDKSAAKLRSDRENIFVLTPELDIAANFNLRALIDRKRVLTPTFQSLP